MNKKNINIVKAIIICIIGIIYFVAIDSKINEFSIRALLLIFSKMIGFILPIMLLSFALSWLFSKDKKKIIWSRTWNITIVLFILILLSDYHAQSQNPPTKQKTEKEFFNEMWADYSNIELSVNSSGLYRSPNGYRITIPEKWVIQNASTLGTEFIASSEDGSGMFLVQVANHKGIKEIPLEQFPYKEMINKFNERANKVEILKEEDIKVANCPGKHIKVFIDLTHFDVTMQFLADFYFIKRDSQFFNIMFRSDSDRYEEYFPIFKEIVYSFSFEDYNKLDN